MPSDQEVWRFQVPDTAFATRKKDRLLGKCIKFTADSITLRMAEMPNNRILQTDDPTKFILLSFGDLRFPDTPMRVTADYIGRLMKAGLFLNNRQYRFYHHSNSQLVSCISFYSWWHTNDFYNTAESELLHARSNLRRRARHKNLQARQLRQDNECCQKSVLSIA